MRLVASPKPLHFEYRHKFEDSPQHRTSQAQRAAVPCSTPPLPSSPPPIHQDTNMSTTSSCVCSRSLLLLVCLLLLPARGFHVPSRGLLPSRVILPSFSSSLSASATSATSASSPPIDRPADRALHLGEVKADRGEFRPALESFREAVDLYKSAVSSSSFSSTVHPPSLLPSLLAYSLTRVAHLTHDALGDSASAASLYAAAVAADSSPSAVSHAGLAVAMEASGVAPSLALPHHERAAEIAPAGRASCDAARFYCSVARERAGDLEGAARMRETFGGGGLVDSWEYVRDKVGGLESGNYFRGTREMLERALGEAGRLIDGEGGMVCEFGVCSGR